MDQTKEDGLEELERSATAAAAPKEEGHNQLIQQQMMNTLDQLSQRVDKLEEQPTPMSPGARGSDPVDSSPSGQAAG